MRTEFFQVEESLSLFSNTKNFLIFRVDLKISTFPASIHKAPTMARKGLSLVCHPLDENPVGSGAQSGHGRGFRMFKE